MSTQGQGQGQDPNPNQNQDPPKNSKQGDACAACNYHHRRCMPNCPLRPYFPQFVDGPNQDFLNCVKHFGMKNLSKLIKDIDMPYQKDAAKSIIYEANARAKDPVGGVTGMINRLQMELNQSLRELDCVKGYLDYFTARNPDNSNVGVQNTSGNLNLGYFPGLNPNFGSNVNVGEQNFSGNMNMNVGYFHEQNPNFSAPTRFCNEASSSGPRNDLDENMNQGYSPEQNPYFASRMRFENEASSSSRLQNELDVNMMNLGYFRDQNPNFSAPSTRFINEASSSEVQNELFGNLYGNMNLVDGDYPTPLINLIRNNATEESGEGITNPNYDVNLNANDLNAGEENELNGNFSLHGNMNLGTVEGINLNFSARTRFNDEASSSGVQNELNLVENNVTEESEEGMINPNFDVDFNGNVNDMNVGVENELNVNMNLILRK